MMDILLYWDKGVGRVTGNETFFGLKKFYDPSLYSVRKVNHHFLTSENWEQSTALLVMPGGRDVPYHELLKGRANRKINDFVEKGGCYLGLCAGAYYGAKMIEFEKGGPLEVCTGRELGFFSGVAKGPALGQGLFCYTSYSGAEAAEVHTSYHFSTFVYYNGGCTFLSPESFDDVSVLASYQSGAVAIVECKRGKGKAILSGVHPEISAHSLVKIAEKHPQVKEIYMKLITAESSREKLWKLILSSCIL